MVRVKCAGLYRRRSSSQSLMLVLAGGSTSACFRQGWYSLVNLWLTSSSGGDMVLSNECGELQFECLNTTRPRLQFPSFKASFFKSSCCNFNKNSVLHTIDQGQREGLYHTIDNNMNKCHWHSPMRKQLRRALGMLNAICQPFASTMWMHQKYIYEQNIFMNKIYLWAKYIHEQNIFMSEIYLWTKYIYANLPDCLDFLIPYSLIITP